jgi:hypothetical protein
MKTIRLLGLIAGFSIASLALPVCAQISIPSDGSDGALNITTNTVIDLSKAVTGVWSNNNSANVGKGIYDASKWAVVFKYSSVNIASNVSVTFSNHPSRAPVVWLVSGAVTINGDLGLDGGAGTTDFSQAEPGPGGFRGGAAQNQTLSPGPGFGPGGSDSGHALYNGSYGTPGIVPLIGGSGGTGNSYGGSAGGGAILIASSSAITVNGSCHAIGGAIINYAGSGGSIRLLADQILGNGALNANFLQPGRIRIDANSLSPNLAVSPAPSLGLPSPVVIWPATNAPTVRIVSIGDQTAPLDPRAQIGTGQDARLFTNAAPIVLETANFPTNGTVSVYIKPRNGQQTVASATFVSGTTNLATWQYQATLPLRDSVIQARCVSP